MKILKIFGIVVGIHLFALILIFANPGCSSTTKTAPSSGDAPTKPAGTSSSSAPITAAPSPVSATTPAAAEPTSSAITFNPNTPAAAAPAMSTGQRSSPTRPNTPVAGALIPEPVSDVTPASTYTVKSGDNLWTIARKNNITVAQLTAANNLSANASLKPGQKLIIPKQSAAAAVAATASSPSAAKAADPLSASSASRPVASEGVKHVVKAGETLGAIARKYDVRQGELAVANNISDPAKIRPGMELVIPGYTSPGAKSGKSTKSSGKSSTASQPAASQPLPTEPSPAQPAPAQPAPVPVIRLDEPAPQKLP